MSESIIQDDYFKFMRDIIVFSSKFNGIREIKEETLFDIGKNEILNDLNDHNTILKKIAISNLDHYFIVKKLEWDSSFFNRPMYKLVSVLFKHNDADILFNAVAEFENFFIANTEINSYCHIELPSEANILIQAFTVNKFRLIETRIHHYLKDIENYNYPYRYSVRDADSRDEKMLYETSSKSRNKFDRFHSDIYFSNEIADKYLGKFAAQTLNGFAEKIIVPNDVDIEPRAFFALNANLKENSELNLNISQLVLTAVDSNTCKGWYEKLLSELIYFLKENGTKYLITNTQTTNKAPIHVNEKLGFKYSHTTHIFALANR